MEQDKLSVEIESPGRRFGFIAIEKGFINTNQLWEALLKQRSQVLEGTKQISMGTILKDMGYLTQQQINEVLEALKKESEVKNSPNELGIDPAVGKKDKED
jgi:hypothetical protein